MNGLILQFDFVIIIYIIYFDVIFCLDTCYFEEDVDVRKLYEVLRL